jgi:hypothetical protein
MGVQTTVSGTVTLLVSSGIANTLVTATPLTPGFPTVSGYTNSNGQVTFALTPTISYTLTFSGPAIRKVTSFTPANSTFTLYTVKNKGTLALSISGQKLSGVKSVYAFHGSIPVRALGVFSACRPGTHFKNSKAKSTSLVMPQSNVSISYLGTMIKKLYDNLF